MKTKLILFTLITTTVLALAPVSLAQEKTKISPEKGRLIAELLVLTRVDQQIVEITDTMLASMERDYPLIVENVLARDKKLSASEKRDLQKYMVARFQAFSEKFRKRLPAEIDYPKFIRDVYYPLYDKFFTAAELRDLIAFYRTDTGQKVVTVTPQITDESLKMTQTLLIPQVLVLIDKILAEEVGLPPAATDKGYPPPPPRQADPDNR